MGGSEHANDDSGAGSGAGNADARLHSPSYLRNRDPILEVLKRVLPSSGILLEVASGSGEHLSPPVRLDGHQPVWPPSRADAMVCLNMLHIAPWSAAEALMRGAGALLSPGGVLYLYGPYLRPDVDTAESNAAFDLSLLAGHHARCPSTPPGATAGTPPA